MPSMTTLTALVGAFLAASSSLAAPTKRGPCPATLPDVRPLDKPKRYGYLDISGRTIGIQNNPTQIWEVHTLSHRGDTSIAQLAVSQYGVTYGAWVQDSATGAIELLPIQSTGASTDIPVEVSLESNCVTSLTLWESHAESILQLCAGNTITLATSLETGCTEQTASLVTA
ncbi:hypothetical protein LTR53_000204 [Teratosphaeriaceae sp. CCFEE 6253]|nr:hypothetical protein LTR53_000204 [Teratosphaeriaceae sp. CCFEE 6253]